MFTVYEELSTRPSVYQNSKKRKKKKKETCKTISFMKVKFLVRPTSLCIRVHDGSNIPFQEYPIEVVQVAAGQTLAHPCNGHLPCTYG